MASSVINIRIDQIVNGSGNVTAATANLSALSAAADRAREALSRQSSFDKTVINMGAFASAVGGVDDSLGKLSEDYLSFDKAMKAVNTMAGKGAEGLSAMTGQVAELSKTIPLAREELANGLYQVISNGVPEENWLTFLEASAKSAVGGMAELGGVVTVTSTIIKNYGMAWDEAGAIQDKIQMTAKNGVTSFEQLQQALPRVTGNAATLGVSVDELMASFATLTGVSGNTAEVSTQLAAIFTALVKPSTQAAKMAQEMGVQFDAAAIKAAGGFQNFIQKLDASVKAYAAESGMLAQEIYSKLFGSAESLRALIPLTGELADKYGENVSAMADASGSIEAAFADMASTGEAKAQLLKNAWASVTDIMGKAAAALQPILSPLALMGQSVAGVRALAVAGGEVYNSFKKALPVINSTTVAAKGASLALKGMGVGLAAWGAVKLFQALTSEGAKAETQAQRVGKALAGIESEAKSASSAEKARLDALYRATQDVTISTEKRIGALRELQRLYPEYFSSMSDEAVLAGQAKDQYDKLAKSIMATAKARAYESKIEDLNRKKLDNAESFRNAGGHEWAQKMQTAFMKETMAGRDPENSPEYRAARNAWQILHDTYLAANDQIDKDIEALSKAYEKSLAERTSSGTTGIGASGTNGKGGSPEQAKLTVSEISARNLASLNDYSKAISDLQKLRGEATSRDEIEQIDALIERIRAARDEFEGLKSEMEEAPKRGLPDILMSERKTLADYDRDIRDLQELRDTSSVEYVSAIQDEIDALEEEKKAILGIRKEAEKPIRDPFSEMSGWEKFQSGWGSVKGMASAVDSLNRVFSDDASAWERASGAIDTFIGIANGAQSVMKLLDSLGIAHTVTKSAEAGAIAATAAAETAAAAEGAISSGVQVTANKIEAASWKELAAAKYMAAHAAIPFAGFGIGAGFVASMEALVTAAGIPMLAEGGLAYGPTLALMGEYAGASSNPEVIAPLDKLRDLVKTDDLGGLAKVEFEIRGDRLVGVAQRRTNKVRRTV
ncbi:MAG: phage tail tape measure protein [Bacteroidales bacterium]|nr:phage tail tape measure protein [Bacteroidales bacterium]